MFTRKVLTCICLFVLLAIGLPVSAQEPTVITLWHGWTGADNTEMLNQTIEQFNSTNEFGIRVEASAFEWDDLFSRLVLATASGEAPDVVMFHNSEVPEYAQRGVIFPLDDLMAQVGLDLSELPTNITEAASIEGQTYCVTGDLHPLGLYYNVDLVTAAGLDPDSPPTNAAEFMQWAEALTVRDANGVATQYGVDLGVTGALPRWLWYALLHQFGGSFFGEDGSVTVNTEAGQQALQFIVDLHAQGLTTGAAQLSGPSAFSAGIAGMRFVGPWEVNSLVREGMNFRTAPVPTIGNQAATWANTHCLALTNQPSDANYVNGMQFIKWFYENYALPGVSVGIIPVSPTVLASDTWTQDERNPFYQAFVDSLDFAILEPSFPQYTQIFSFARPTALSTNLEAAMVGDLSVADALAEMEAGINEQIEMGF
jgi:multiple sugar transport system substrate-binding protein